MFDPAIDCNPGKPCPMAASDPLVVFGCGAHGQTVLEWVRAATPNRPLRLTDDDPAHWGRRIMGCIVMPPEEALAGGPFCFCCPIGNNATREAVSLRLLKQGHFGETFRHPASVVSPSATVGAGSMLMALAAVNTLARAGEGCIANTGCAIEHHCEIGDYVHLAPHVSLGGGVRIGSRALLGLGAVVLPALKVGEDAVIGAGAVITRDVPPGAVVAGNPARLMIPVH